MPAFFDSGEFGKNSTMPALDLFDSAVLVPGLSKLIGCDALLSTWAARPRTAKLLTKHLKRGALLVEIKRLSDLPGSLLNHQTNHLQKQTIRMIGTGARPVQRVLLYTGVHLPTSEGNLQIGEFNGRRITWKRTEYNYQHFQRAKSKLMDSGLLRWEGLASNQEIPIWVADKLRHLKEYQTNPVKIIPTVQSKLTGAERKQLRRDLQSIQTTEDDTLRDLRLAEGAQAILALFNSIGLGKAKQVLKYCGGSLAWALQFLTNPKHASCVPGVGAKTIAEFRKQLGLFNDMDEYGMFVLNLENELCDICPRCKEKQNV